MNHPREPGRAIYTLPYSDTDIAVYDVAFFATNDMLSNSADNCLLDIENDSAASSSELHSIQRLSGLDSFEIGLGLYSGLPEPSFHPRAKGLWMEW